MTWRNFVCFNQNLRTNCLFIFQPVNFFFVDLVKTNIRYLKFFVYVVDYIEYNYVVSISYVQLCFHITGRVKFQGISNHTMKKLRCKMDTITCKPNLYHQHNVHQESQYFRRLSTFSIPLGVLSEAKACLASQRS